jgi:uncharacterized protein YbjT (DUF2867 family)
MPSAFVTGGSGFIGGMLVKRLRDEGWAVRALARSEAAAARLRELGAEPVTGDLGDGRSLRTGAEGCDVAFSCRRQGRGLGRPARVRAGQRGRHSERHCRLP